MALLALSSRHALAAQDPTRPPAKEAVVASRTDAKLTQPLPSLRYIKYSEGRRVAMVDDQLLEEGQSARGMTVRRILPDAVVIIHNGKEKTLKMFGSENTAH